MKNLLKTLLMISVLSGNAMADAPASVTATTPAIAPDTTQLTCQVGAVCFEQSVKASKSNFHIEPGSVVRVEVMQQQCNVRAVLNGSEGAAGSWGGGGVGCG